MPGSIQVTVLEFKGVSAKSLKVSVGRRQFHTTSDKGDFSFPITKLGEDLVVALLDVGGNQIAHADIRTMQIVEKGYWDEVFSMIGGGHVHLKLRFVLSEEDRYRIRIMRETAVKKKLEMNPNINLRLFETTVSTPHENVETITQNEQKVSDFPKGFVEIDVMRPTVNNSQAGSSLTSATSPPDPSSSFQKEGLSIPQSAIIPVKDFSPNETDGSCQGAPYSSGKKGMQIESLHVHETEREPEDRSETQPTGSSMLLGSSISDKDTSVAPISLDNTTQNSRIQVPRAKTPTNVKKMINAFENSKLQEVKSLKKAPSVPSQLNRYSKGKSLKKAPSVPSQLNRFRKAELPEDREPKVVLHIEGERSTPFNDHLPDTMQQASTTVTETELSEAPKEFEVNGSNSQLIDQTVKELKVSTEDLTRQSTSATATATTSGRMDEGQYQDTECDELYSETLNSYESVTEASGGGRGTGLKSSSVVKFEVDSNPTRIALDEYYSAQRSGMWIFPGNTTRMCVTTAGKQVLESVGDHHREAETGQVNGNSSEPEVEEKNLMHEALYIVGNNQNKIEDQTKSQYSGSPDDSSNGPFGQVIRIAVILGFGVLVLLTRQREPRKKHREENS